ncbi:MAG: recombinase family protein [Candidatus Dehalobacter alkaniphilus]
MRVAIYCRVGNSSQLSEEIMERKSEALNVLAKKHGHTIECAVHEYGSCRDCQHGSLEKISDIVESGRIDAVLVDDISQIGRDFFKTHEYLGHLRKHNVRLLQANVLKRLI